MKEYVISVSFAMILCTFASLMVPSSAYDGIMKIICGLAVVCTLLSPIKKVSLSGINIPNLMEYKDTKDLAEMEKSSKDNFDRLLGTKTLGLVADEINLYLREKCGEDVSAKISGETLWIYNAPPEHRRSIENYVKKTYGFTVAFG